MLVDFEVRGQQGINFFTGGRVIMKILGWSDRLKLKHLEFVSKNTQFFTSQDINWWAEVVWTLIMMAPFHCRGSISEQVM